MLMSLAFLSYAQRGMPRVKSPMGGTKVPKIFFTPTRSNPKTGLDAIFLGWRTEKATTTLWAGDHADQYNCSRVHTKVASCIGDAGSTNHILG